MKFIYCLLIIGFATNINAQAKFGVRAGLNLANVNISSEGLSISPDGKVGLTIAGIANIGITETFSIQPEVHFIQKGYKLEVDFLGSSSEQKLKLNYLEVPIHAKYKFSDGNIAGYVLAGPSIGYALSGKNENCLDGDCDTEDLEFNDDDGFNRTEVGLSIGGGVHIGQIFVDLRYVLGVSNFASDDVSETEIKNKGFQIGVGYMF